MRIELLDSFRSELEDQVRYIARDKPSAAKKFKRDILNSISLLRESPYTGRPSIYFEDPVHRDLIFKGYKVIYKVDETQGVIFVLGLVNMQRGPSSK